MRERYFGNCPFQIVVNQHLIHQGYSIISTSAFSNRNRYCRYVDEEKTIGQIRTGGFDIIIFDKSMRLIGAEVKPELSWNEFQRALGAVIVNLTSVFGQSRVEEGMIIMPINSLDDDRTLARKQLIERINSAVKYCVLPFRISIKYISVACRIAHHF